MKIFKKILLPIYKFTCKFVNLDPLRRKIKKSAIKRAKRKGPIRIGFIVQMPAVWDKTEPVYLELQKNNNIETIFILAPHFDVEKWHLTNDYKTQTFYSTFKNSQIYKAVSENNCVVELSNFNLDYVFYERPYDAYLPQNLHSNYVSQFTNICYIPYGFRCSPDFDDVLINNEFHLNADYIFCDSKEQKNAIMNFYEESNNKPNNNIFTEGYPSLEPYIDLFKKQKSNKITSVMWTPRFSYEGKIGGSHYFEYKDTIISREFLGNASLVFRPHPMMFESFINKKLMTARDKNTILKNISDLGGTYDKESTFYTSCKKCDILITDISSIIINYFITGKPIIFCNNNGSRTELFDGLINCTYVANNEKELKEHMKNLLNGNDYLKEQRNKFIEENFMYHKGASKRIAQILVDDFNKRYNASL